jgi:hypothetical protein
MKLERFLQESLHQQKAARIKICAKTQLKERKVNYSLRIRFLMDLSDYLTSLIHH